MSDKIALLIEWTPQNGKRAGNINPKDPKLQCHGWQNMDVIPAVELRIVEDDRDLSQYTNIQGVTILHGRERINKVIEDNFPPKISIEDDLIYSEHVKEHIRNKKIKINDLPENRIERLKVLKEKHDIKGIKITEPMKV